MRFFAIERIFRGIIVGAAAIAVWKFSHSQHSIEKIFDDNLPLFKPIAGKFGWDLAHSKLVTMIHQSLTMKSSTLRLVAIALAGYALIPVIQAGAPWMLQPWGADLAVRP